MPSPIMAPAMSWSMMQASLAPEATSSRASPWDCMEATFQPFSWASSSAAEPASTAKVNAP